MGKMVKWTIRVPTRLLEWMSEHPEIDWNAVAIKAIRAKMTEAGI